MTAILLLQGAVSEEAYNDVHYRHKFAYMLRHKAQVHVAAYLVKLWIILSLAEEHDSNL